MFGFLYQRRISFLNTNISSSSLQSSSPTLPYQLLAAGPVEQEGGMDGKPIDAQRLQALAEAVREGNVG